MGLTELKSRYQQDFIPSGSCRGHLLLAVFQPLEDTCIPWFMAPYTIFKANKVASSLLSDLCFYLYISLFDSDHIKIFVRRLGCLIIQGNLLIWRSLITSVDFHLPCKATYSQILEVMNITGGPLFNLSHTSLTTSLSYYSQICLIYI